MQVHYKAELLFFQLRDQFPEIMIVLPDPVNIWIGTEHWPILYFGKEMYFSTGQLLLQAPHQRARQDNVSDRAEADYQDFIGMERHVKGQNSKIKTTNQKSK